MSSSIVVSSQDAESLGLQIYSRKEKSLGVLVSNFLRLYNRDDVDLIGLDDAAGQLGVERRRIYDVVNILESIGIVARRGKNQYSWKGFGEIPRSLNELKEQGMRERLGDSSTNNSDKVSNDGEREEPLILTPDDQENSSSSKLDQKKEKSLWLLSQNFVKMFLCSDDDLITLDSAAKALLSDSQDSVHMRTKVRRLYDIANVFASMNLIEKTHIPVTRKPAYRWLGSKSIAEKGSSLFNSDEPKKRVFGTEITNLRAKRNKTDCSSIRKQIGYKKHDQENKEQESKPAASKYVFGPFSPTGASKTNNNNVGKGRLLEIEALASTYQPQYCNHEITGLLGHFTEAWKKWYAEVDRNK
ncbi:E2F/DP family winged-helix DNA-binding domain [Arabidopsis thaliana x Arabidopsis arenosa]|uniref:E2F/DP family winged-helix DNA-binding domain n=1 Tax=Arabidopsis thaliana x Arabidopsis arenosa TaxID=1240361 RepID=A0A8T2AM53_9BRAS|nr:E2F/DP family winged-helix DNA-binding domain [Arabidopsis thaliana x Arabidopsis arenosa]